MRLQLKILLPIIGLFMVFLCLSGYLAYRETAAGLREALIDNMDGEAEALGRALSNMGQESKGNIQRIASQQVIEDFFANNEFNENTFRAMPPRLTRIVDSYADFDRLTLLDMKGNVVATTHPEASKFGDSFADRAYFQSAARGTPFLANPFMSRVTKKPVMTAAAPVKVDGKVVGVAYAALNLDRFF